MRAGGDKRGNSKDRAARKWWMLSEAAGFGGDGESVPCVFCALRLTYATVEADRIDCGGSYRRSNVQPACRPCNLARSDDGELSAEEVLLRVARTTARTGRLTPALAVA